MAEPDQEVLGEALVAALAPFSGGLPCGQLSHLMDGTVLFNVLASVDGHWFKAPRNADISENWVLRFNNVKRLFKLLSSYFEEVLGHDTTYLEAPNFTLMARDQSEDEALKMAQIVVAAIAQSDNNHDFVNHIQTLDASYQAAIMMSIELTMASLTSGDAEDAEVADVDDAEGAAGDHHADETDAEGGVDSDGAVRSASAAAAASRPLQRGPGQGRSLRTQPSMLLDQNGRGADQVDQYLVQNRRLQQENAGMRHELESVTASRDALAARLHELETTAAQRSEAGQADWVLRSKVDELTAQLSSSEERRVDADLVVQEQHAQINEMQRRMESAVKKADEATRLREELDALKYQADQYSKNTALLEKYKKRLDHSADLKRQVAELERTLEQSQARMKELESAAAKTTACQPLLETYAEQLEQLEALNADLSLENQKLHRDVEELAAQLARSEEEHVAHQNHVAQMEEQLHELSLMEGHSQSAAQRLASASPAVAAASTTPAAARSDLAAAQRQVRDLQHQLDEARRAKDTLEGECRVAFQKALHFENKAKALENVAAAVPAFGATAASGADGTAGCAGCASLRQQLASRDAAAKTMSPAITAGVPTGEAMTMWQQMDGLMEEHRQHMAEIHRLHGERDGMQGELTRLQAALAAAEQEATALRASVAALEAQGAGASTDETSQKLGQTTQRLVLLTEQNKSLHQAMRSAKAHIASQDTMIKTLGSGGSGGDGDPAGAGGDAAGPASAFREALASAQSRLRETEFELERARQEIMDTRSDARREQKIVFSLFMNMNAQQEINKFLGNPAGTVVTGHGERTTTAPRAWLNQRQLSDHQSRR
ncbi:hypothetical protein CXG81DRAFT_23587 [Caulochytrium protostelioides]|uniref:HOOK N-terminal domain-containing protein n=1 Tax=Caulochytrium protostelioides TaxID=1555241 RepID=A0A4P9XE35_9FUNG|nr:hypothetical protein CXG81DRAFT_23587 [Caulochytrium protostelioides]|eukprot:RKP03752.1 hypothetical protein CXG81DRAFT_23587 [Caulochytrium protostelioides]